MIFAKKTLKKQTQNEPNLLFLIPDLVGIAQPLAARHYTHHLEYELFAVSRLKIKIKIELIRPEMVLPVRIVFCRARKFEIVPGQNPRPLGLRSTWDKLIEFEPESGGRFYPGIILIEKINISLYFRPPPAVGFRDDLAKSYNVDSLRCIPFDYANRRPERITDRLRFAAAR